MERTIYRQSDESEFDVPSVLPNLTKGARIVKRIVFVLLCVLTLTILFPLTASADMGPKPSVVINFSGLDGKAYYGTLLSSVKSTGPYSALNSNGVSTRYEEGDKDYEIFLKFAGYHDTDGYYFMQFFEDCTQTHQFSWTYYPPKEFKILLYFPETDSFIISDTSYERYAFDSYFTAEVSGISFSVEKSYDYVYEAISLIARIVLTIVAELGIALLFGFRERKQFRFITLINVITQIALNLTLNIINYHSGELAFVMAFLLLEVMVFIVEAILYTWYLKRYSQEKVTSWKPGVYALVANIVSFALGLGLAHWIPGIF